MTDRELMCESLSALRSCSGAPHWPALQPIVTALRERLARLDFEMQPCAGRNCGSTNPNLHSAECFEDYEKSTGMATQPFGYFRYDLRLDAWLQNRAGNQGVAFYTAPPARQPLPPQLPCEMTPAERKMFRLGWLECEAAHGIKGEA